MFPTVTRHPAFRYGCGGGLALATAYFAVSVLPPYMAPLAWTITVAALFIIGKQAWFDWRDSIDAAAEDAAIEDEHGD